MISNRKPSSTKKCNNTYLHENTAQKQLQLSQLAAWWIPSKVTSSLISHVWFLHQSPPRSVYIEWLHFSSVTTWAEYPTYRLWEHIDTEQPFSPWILKSWGKSWAEKVSTAFLQAAAPVWKRLCPPVDRPSDAPPPPMIFNVGGIWPKPKMSDTPAVNPFTLTTKKTLNPFASSHRSSPLRVGRSQGWTKSFAQETAEVYIKPSKP